MPQVVVSASVSVKERQQDTDPTGEVNVEFTDTQVGDYNGPIKLTLAATGDNQTRVIDVSHLTSLRLLIVKLIAGQSFRLALRRAASENTDLVVRRFFAAELTNIEQIKLTGDGQSEVEVQVELVSING